MSVQKELESMNLHIQEEQLEIKREAQRLSERKKTLKSVEAEYLRLSLEHLQSTK